MEMVYDILLILGTLIGIFVLYLLILAIIPGISVRPQPLEKKQELGSTPHTLREEVRFEVRGTPISAWLYLPDDRSVLVPCIVMGHGAGGTKDMGLETYAIRFREAGYAVLAFDYRHFGASGGKPRQLMWIPYQLEDYEAAIRYVRDHEAINPVKVALWGTSASGGHVLVTAAKDHCISCVVAQCPGLDGRAAAKMAFKRVGFSGLRLMMHGQRDLVRSWFGLSAHKIPIVGKPGTTAMLTMPGSWETFGKFASADFVNEACARIVIRGDKYRPIKKARQVRCPVLLQICEKDEFTPLRTAEKAKKLLGSHAEMKRYPIGHFDIYFGEYFENSLRDQLEFLKKHL